MPAVRWPDIPEITTLAETIAAWWPVIEAFLSTRAHQRPHRGYESAHQAGETRAACGFRNRDDYRRRVRLPCTRSHETDQRDQPATRSRSKSPFDRHEDAGRCSSCRAGTGARTRRWEQRATSARSTWATPLPCSARPRETGYPQDVFQAFRQSIPVHQGGKGDAGRRQPMLLLHKRRGRREHVRVVVVGREFVPRAQVPRACPFS